MKLFTRLYQLAHNLIGLLIGLSRYERLYWGVNSCRTIQCTIDRTAVVHGNYVLTNVKIGYSSYVSNNAHIVNTTIGKFCSIGPNLVSGWGIHPIHGISTHPAFYSSKKKSALTFCTTNQADEHKPIVIGNDVFIGANVTILDGITVGDGAVIGAGAVVSKDIPAYAVAVGCPIKIVKYRFSPDVINDLLKIQWWDHEEMFDSVKQNFHQIDHFLSRNTVDQE